MDLKTLFRKPSVLGPLSAVSGIVLGAMIYDGIVMPQAPDSGRVGNRLVIALDESDMDALAAECRDEGLEATITNGINIALSTVSEDQDNTSPYTITMETADKAPSCADVLGDRYPHFRARVAPG